MHIKIISGTEGELFLSDHLPPSLESYRLPQARVRVHSGSFGKLLYQEMDAGGCMIYCSHYFIAGKETFSYHSNEPLLTLQFSLEESFDADLEGLGRLTFHERGYNLFYVPAFSGQVRFRKNRRYTCLNINYSIACLSGLATGYPLLGDFLGKVARGLPALLQPVNRVATPQMMGVIDRILHIPYTDGRHGLLLNARVTELIILALQQWARCPPGHPIHLSGREVDRIYNAKRILLDNMQSRPALPALARKVGLSEYRLRAGFRKIYGLPVTRFMVHARMETARRLLQESDHAIDEIAFLTGYAGPGSFSHAFARYFGYRPGRSGKGFR